MYDDDELYEPFTLDLTIAERLASFGDLIVNYAASANSALPRGFGVAAEKANHYIDCLSGKDARHIGSSNTKNGADRIVAGQFIQTKYCSTGASCIRDCFDAKGNFRYYDKQGKPMQIEVPKDKYDDAVQALAAKIVQGKLKGVTDKAEASRIVRRGHLTYEQGRNLGRFGTVESITFDTVTGAVSASGVAAVSALTAFMAVKSAGEELHECINSAVKEGLRAGGSVLGNNVIVSQVARSSIDEMMTPFSKVFAESLGGAHLDKIAALKGCSRGAVINQTARAFRGTVVCATVATAGAIGSEVIDAATQKKSVVEALKNSIAHASSISAEIGAAFLVGTFLAGTAVASMPAAGLIIFTVSFSAGYATGSSVRNGTARLVDIVVPGNGIDDILESFVERTAQLCDFSSNELRIFRAQCDAQKLEQLEVLKQCDLAQRAQVCLQICTEHADDILQQRKVRSHIGQREFYFKRVFTVDARTRIVRGIALRVLHERGFLVEEAPHQIIARKDAVELLIRIAHAVRGAEVAIYADGELGELEVVARIKGEIHDRANRAGRDLLLANQHRHWPMNLVIKRGHYDLVR